MTTKQKKPAKSPQADLCIPYIGINVHRLPCLVGVAIDTDIRSRAKLRDLYTIKFHCSLKTGKEYVSSLINLRVLKKTGIDKFDLDYTSGSREEDLLLNFARQSDWPSFLEFLVSSNPVYEVLREVVFETMEKTKGEEIREIINSARELMASKKIGGSVRLKTLEAFVRIIRKCKESIKKTVGLKKETFSPRIQKLISDLRPSQLHFLESLVESVYHLRAEKPFYSEMSIISIGDIASYLPENFSKIFPKEMLILRDKGLIFLHATIPSAATALGIKTIEQNGKVYSAFSLPRSLERK